MKKICIIYANCQNKLIAQYLGRSQQFNQEYLIKRFPVHQLMEKGSTIIPNRLLKQAKLFIYQPVKDIHGDRSTKYILSKLSSDCQCISFPPLYCTGYFPQYCKNPVNKVIKPNYPFGVFPHGDTNIISLLEQGKSVAEITEILSDPNFYTQEFLLANINETLNELARRESQLSIKVTSFIKAHYQNHYLFYTQNHPSDILGIYVANQILKLLNMPPLGDELSLFNPVRGVLDNIQIPIYPSVIKHLGLTFANQKNVYRNASFCTNQITFERYISEYVDLHLSDSESSIFYHFQGIKFSKQNKLAKASAVLKKAITIQPNNAAYYGELGNVLQKQNNFTDAEDAYQKAIELSPNWEYFYKLLGDVLSKKEDFTGAILAYKQAVALNPENADFYCSLGDTFVKQNNFDAAEQAYQQAVVIDPTKAYYYQCLGNIFDKRNNLNLAISNYKKAIEIHPNKAYFYYLLANAHLRQNNFREAITACQKAIKLNPKNPNFYCVLGNIQLQKGDFDDASKVYQQAIKLDPNQMTQIFANLGNFIKEKTTTEVTSYENVSAKLVQANS
ncbi:WcbI family polysaccharide biosynthesis putative acetyltransferase [Pleurocapsa sp. PCC 7319]|uniref:WcbI family polysaccharide biosynthesis putative acetyltransferase n=1 Tax=Pleurocapsa sp. PCC 7319 TaxID=118161 RepID=UPI00037B54A3|nr:WcbI family polysaccharide biosynthesis putative acetyltransferase [Pleurocapsa sp. PCC 7319]